MSIAGLVAGTTALALAGCGPGVEEQRPTRTVTVEVGPTEEGGGSSRPASEPVSVPGVDDCEGAREPTTEDNLRRAEMAIRCLTNAARQQQGLAELRFDERLARAAATRSSDMAEQDYFAHRGPDGGNVQRAVSRTGYLPEGGSYLLGENIGWAPAGGATPAQLMRSWLDSPTHRENIMSEAFTEIGVGAVAGVPRAGAEPGATYTQVFGVTGEAAREAQTS